ncbi:hypothetical protein [Candidatus Solirubrobacter pratensis]|uniref:hypothetical protein n=1 Tax=Candidatus Solirubrobacter pratensis TaxID=1298857 RepID=UPI0004087513|nr:hypothetical protein [Candidatus Solirubrobacter pratensis]
MEPLPRLHPDDIETIAARVAALLGASSDKHYLTAKEVSARYGVSTDWVYDHKAELGAVPLGQGRKPRLRYPLVACERFMAERAEQRVTSTQPKPKRRTRRPRKDNGLTAAGNPRLAIPEPIIPVLY